MASTESEKEKSLLPPPMKKLKAGYNPDPDELDFSDLDPGLVVILNSRFTMP